MARKDLFFEFLFVKDFQWLCSKNCVSPLRDESRGCERPTIIVKWPTPVHTLSFEVAVNRSIFSI